MHLTGIFPAKAFSAAASCSSRSFRRAVGRPVRGQVPSTQAWAEVYIDVMVLDVISLVVEVVTALAALTLAFIGLRISAKPGIRVIVGQDRKPVVFVPGKEGTLSIYVELRGYFYGKPTATDLKLTVNVDTAWEITRLYWTAPGPTENKQVGHGKGLKSPPWWVFWRRWQSAGSSKYIVAEHLWLTRAERGETLEVTLVAPDEPGDYVGWVHGSAKEGDCGVHVFKLLCRNQ